MFLLLKKPECLVLWLLFLKFLVGCELRKPFLELPLSLEVLVFLLPAAEGTVSLMVIKDVFLDQPEEFLASQM